MIFSVPSAIYPADDAICLKIWMALENDRNF
jgi:hypothetical protein